MSQSAWNADYNSAKGSLLVGNATRPVVRTVGTDGQALIANSAQADGVNWANLSASNVNGSTSGVAPAPGIIGEQIRSYINVGGSVPLTSSLAADITSISLTAGVWDVSSVVIFRSAGGGPLITGAASSISTVSATLSGNEGDDELTWQYTAGQDTGAISQTIPSFRVTTAVPVIYYLVAACTFTIGNMAANGRLSATRAG